MRRPALRLARERAFVPVDYGVALQRYAPYIRRPLVEALTFRGSLLLGWFASFLYLYISVAFWRGVYGSSESAAGYTLPQMIAYMVGGTVLGAAFTNAASRRLARTVRDGTVVVDLLRPVWLPLLLLADSLGAVLGDVLVVGIPMLLTGGLAFHMIPPREPTAYLALLCLVPLGFLIRFLLSAIVGYTAFWTTLTGSLGDIVYWVFFNLFGGAFVPYAFFPKFLGAVLAWSPMASLYSAPLDVLVGKTPPSGAVPSILLDLAWVGLLSGAIWLLHRNAMRRVVSLGG